MSRPLNFKKLDTANWLASDMPPVFSFTQEQWVSLVTKTKLSHQVSHTVMELFEVARGSILYGWFFYPLLTLGSEQLFRVMESAVRERCILAAVQIKKPLSDGKQDRNYGELIEELIKLRIIQESDRERWSAARKLRNSASHPSIQTILTPSDAASMIKHAADRINALFAAQNPPGIYYPPLESRPDHP